MVLSVWAQKPIFHNFSFTYVLIGVLLKGIVESSVPVLSTDEPLTPNNNKVMTVRNFRRRTQNTKNGKHWTFRFQF